MQTQAPLDKAWHPHMGYLTQMETACGGKSTNQFETLVGIRKKGVCGVCVVDVECGHVYMPFFGLLKKLISS